MLGVRPGADAAEVRAAYRRKVKECHPDQFTDAQRQKQAQDELIRLNLAYEQALKLASQRRVGFNLIAQEEAKHFALRLMDKPASYFYSVLWNKLYRRDILTRQTDIPAMTHGRVYFGVVHSLIGILLTDNAVAGFGNRRTGHHPNRLAPRRTEHLSAARAGFADYTDHSGMLKRGIRNVFAVQRIAIQRGTIERRHIHRRNDILRRDSVQCIQKRQLLRVRHRLRVRKQNA